MEKVYILARHEMRHGGTDIDMMDHVLTWRNLLLQTVETMTNPIVEHVDPRTQKWTHDLIREVTIDQYTFLRAPAILPAHSCLYDELEDSDEEKKETSLEQPETNKLQYLPGVEAGKPIAITTDWATTAAFDPTIYSYMNVVGTGNCLYLCLSLAIYRKVDRHKYLENLF
jgi:hypothetical protein